MKNLNVGRKAPNFKGLSSKGAFDFHNFCKDKWTAFFLSPCNFSNIDDFDAFTNIKMQLYEKDIQFLALSKNFEKRRFWSSYNTRTSFSIGFPTVLDADNQIKSRFSHGFEIDVEDQLNRFYIINPEISVCQIITYRKEVGIDINDIMMVVQSQMSCVENQVLRPLMRVRS